MSEHKLPLPGEFQALLRKSYALAERGEFSSAIEVFDRLAQGAETRIAGLRGRAAIHELAGNFGSAIEDLESIVAGSGQAEPADLYMLGLLYLRLNKPQEARATLAESVQICLSESFDYYLHSCRLLHGEALLRLNRAAEALSELELLPSAYSVYVYGKGMRGKEAMVSEARHALA